MRNRRTNSGLVERPKLSDPATGRWANLNILEQPKTPCRVRWSAWLGVKREQQNKYGKLKLIIGSKQRHRIWVRDRDRNLVECESLDTLGHPAWHLLVALRHLLRNRAMTPNN